MPGRSQPVRRRGETERILVIDIGGRNVKLYCAGRAPVKIPSGPALTPRRMVRLVREATRGWDYDRISIGYPGPVAGGRPMHDPANLGRGWFGFDFDRAFGKPLKLINDAAMQALGSYRGGRMLFLGLGTGLGSAMIVEGRLEPMELSILPYKHGRTFEDYLGRRGLDKYGKKRWRRHVLEVAQRMKRGLAADYVVLGGGNAKRLKALPAGLVLGNNADAFVGGRRLWAPGMRIAAGGRASR